MPDDQRLPFSVIREVARATNVPVNQVRQSMRQTVQQNVQRPSEIPRPRGAFDLPAQARLGPTLSQEFKPRSFGSQETQGGTRQDGASNDAPDGTGTKEVIIVDDGVANLYTIKAKLIGPV